MTSVVSTFIASGIAAFLVMLLFYLISLVKKDNTIADIAWEFGFIIAVTTALVKNQLFEPRQIIVTLLVAIWGLRLAFHISAKKRGEPEDLRYQRMRERWGRQVVLRSLSQVYFLQWIFLQIIASSAVYINSTPGPETNALDLLGVVIWTTGFLFESVGDYQLSLFRKNPTNKGKIMTLGLWRYSRHPNYFGEALLWWGIFLMSLSLPHGVLTIFSPLTIGFLLLRVSGIPALENKYENNPDYQEYKKRTSVFFPWLPKEN